MKIYNFSAGPAMLPEAVMRKAQAEFIDFQGRGSGILELSHRGKFFQPVIDRAEAIKTAVMLSAPGDILLVAGKGHENYQIIGTERLPFNDRECVEGWFSTFGR